MRKSFISSIVVLCLFLSVEAAEVFYFPQIGDGVAGDLNFLTEIILVNTGSDTQATVDFFDSDGNPLAVSFGDLGTDSSFVVPLSNGASFSAKTPGTGPLQVGYARIATDGDGVGGTAVFTGIHGPSGVVLFEAGVPASTISQEFSLFVDSLGTRDTGLAMLLPADDGQGVAAEGDAVLALYDLGFNQIATTDVPLAPGQKYSKFVNEFFDGDDLAKATASEMTGLLTVQGPGLASVTLRQNVPASPFPGGVTTLTAFPVVEGSPENAVLSSNVARLSSGHLQVTLVTGDRSRAGQVRYRLWYGDQLLKEETRHLSGLVDVHRLAADDSTVSRVEAIFLSRGGSELGSLDLIP